MYVSSPVSEHQPTKNNGHSSAKFFLPKPLILIDQKSSKSGIAKYGHEDVSPCAFFTDDVNHLSSYGKKNGITPSTQVEEIHGALDIVPEEAHFFHLNVIQHRWPQGAPLPDVISDAAIALRAFLIAGGGASVISMAAQEALDDVDDSLSWSNSHPPSAAVARIKYDADSDQQHDDQNHLLLNNKTYSKMHVFEDEDTSSFVGHHTTKCTTVTCYHTIIKLQREKMLRSWRQNAEKALENKLTIERWLDACCLEFPYF
jgi:hypothetical protein